MKQADRKFDPAGTFLTFFRTTGRTCKKFSPLKTRFVKLAQATQETSRSGRRTWASARIVRKTMRPWSQQMMRRLTADPDACLSDIFEQIAQGDYAAAGEKARELLEWMENGGFMASIHLST